jgi:CRP/FNR family transcriptional regulator, cyclic AMP receptor protein
MEASRLAAIPLFSGLDAADLATIAATTCECGAPAGQTLAAEGDFGFAVYAIETGTADVVMEGDVVRTLGPGDVFGEVAVLAAGRRTASVVATSPVEMIALLNRDVWALERRAPAVAARLRELLRERLDTAAN